MIGEVVIGACLFLLILIIGLRGFSNDTVEQKETKKSTVCSNCINGECCLINPKKQCKGQSIDDCFVCGSDLNDMAFYISKVGEVI